MRIILLHTKNLDFSGTSWWGSQFILTCETKYWRVPIFDMKHGWNKMNETRCCESVLVSSKFFKRMPTVSDKRSLKFFRKPRSLVLFRNLHAVSHSQSLKIVRLLKNKIYDISYIYISIWFWLNIEVLAHGSFWNSQLSFFL